MIPYISSTRKNNTIECNVDFVVLYNDSVVVMSLIDISGKVKKVLADFVQGGGDITLYDREDYFTNRKISSGSYYGEKNKYKYKLSKHNNKMTHGIIYNNEKDNFIFDWDGRGLVKSLTLFLRNNHYLPLTEEIVQKVLDRVNTEYLDILLEECEIYTSKKDMKKVKVWKFNSVSYFKELLEEIELDIRGEDNNFSWDEINDISDYLTTFADPIKDKLKENVNILYDKNRINPKTNEKIKLFDGQIPITQGGVESLKQKGNRFVYIAAEPGVGKTIIGTKINHIYQHEINKPNYCTLVVAPTTTLTQWEQEIKSSILEDVDVMIISSTNEFIRFYEKTKLKVDKPTYILVGKETFKLSYKVKHGINVVKREVDVEVERGLWNDVEKQSIEVCTCPDCGMPLKNPLRKSKITYFTEKDFNKPKKSNYKCSNCDSVLWQATYVKNRKTSVIDFIKKKNIKFDSLIEDEVHEGNNYDSIIGAASRDIKKHAKKCILLSGTITNGYASSIYNVLFSLIPNTLKNDNVFDKEKFIKAYGTLMAVTKNKDNEYHVTSRTQLKDSDYQEVEGINPLVFTKYFANNFIFAELSEVRSDLPKLKEQYIPIEHIKEVKRSEYNLQEEIKEANPFNSSFYNDSVIKHYTNKPFNWNEIGIEFRENSEKSNVYIQPKNISEKIILPKENKLVEICKNEKENNRKTWVYCDFVTTGKYSTGEPLQDRLKRILEKNGLKVFVLKSNVRTLDRRETIMKNKNNYDVFISHPKLINVGINLQWCTNYVFYSPSYHVNIVKQAMKRGLRINSTEDNHIYHLYYNDGIENEIMERFKLKLVESESVQAKFIDVDVKRTASSLGAKIEKELIGAI